MFCTLGRTTGTLLTPPALWTVTLCGALGGGNPRQSQKVHAYRAAPPTPATADAARTAASKTAGHLRRTGERDQRCGIRARNRIRLRITLSPLRARQAANQVRAGRKAVPCAGPMGTLAPI